MTEGTTTSIADRMWGDEYRIEQAARELTRTAGISPVHAERLHNATQSGDAAGWTSSVAALLHDLVEKHQ